MDNIIVYVDDAAYAMHMLQPVLPAGATTAATRWIVVGCPPRMTHRVSKWVTHSARESWRGKWADKMFAQLLPLLEQNGNAVITQLAKDNLPNETENLIRQHGAARVLDARRPKVEQLIQTVTPAPAQNQQGVLSYALAWIGAGLLVAVD